ncbi:CYTH and CHAD domain-containing protein [Longispora albida]|uniref:CYTH and CHAD domain-containing protein n=1 Tax=Longispora albida TaxID=203523 RepID=UPI0003633338|nr:CYTH and CHAD domain-containing protein [Longispora albida]
MEEERKFDVDGEFELPAWFLADPAVVPMPVKRLRATYFDTADLRLARAGASLRFRSGDAEPWTVKLPTGTPGIRREISASGSPGRPPAGLAGLVTTFSRSEPLAPVVVLSTQRTPYEIRGQEGEVLAELVDDQVSVYSGRRIVTRFREIEVERKAGPRSLLDTVAGQLAGAGAVEGEFTSKFARALGGAASAPSDLTAPQPLPRKKASAADVITDGLRRDIGHIIQHDPLVRLRAEVGGGDTAVHQMRVGCRRLRSRLRVFAGLLDPRWAGPLRAELSWLAGVLGGARDAEVLRARLSRTAHADELAPLDAEAVSILDAALAARHAAALADLDEALASDRYLALLDQLFAVAAGPKVSREAKGRAAAVLPPLAARPYRRLAKAIRDLTPDAPDDVWHAARVRAKRARYAIEAVAPVLPASAGELAARLAAAQGCLGEHQDAAMAAVTWLELAEADPARLGVTAGRLAERERVAVRAARARFPEVWGRAGKKKVTRWLGAPGGTTRK